MVSMAFCVSLYLMSTSGVESWWLCCLVWVKFLNDEITDNVIAFNCRNAQDLSLPKNIMHNLLVNMTCISRLNFDVTFS